MREVYSEIIENAFGLGITDAWAFWHMTPAEISGRLKAHKVAHDNNMSRDDLLAWMIGLYAGKAINNPKKYPKKPDLIRIETPKPVIEMDDENIKTVLTAYAEIHNAVEGAK